MAQNSKKLSKPAAKIERPDAAELARADPGAGALAETGAGALAETGAGALGVTGAGALAETGAGALANTTWGLAGKRILVAVSAGVAAYKTCILVRDLMRAGANIKIVMTEAARAFVSAETFQALSGEPVFTDLWDDRIQNRMAHIELGRWADAIMIAPASADLMARLAHGICNDLISTLCLARPRERCLLLMAPAMNREMWSHPATQRNATRLEQDGVIMLGPDRGDQACGETGDGRMLEPEDLFQALEHVLSPKLLTGRCCVITAGPTFEAIDPVRGITNRSSGKMGFAIAKAASQAGASVQLIAGPVSLATPWQVQRRDVVSATEMKHAVDQAIESLPESMIEGSIFISVAAVADWRPAAVASQKIKKQRGETAPSIRFVENPDILASVAARRPRPFCVGFAAESEMLREHGEAKRKTKNVPLLAANIGHETFGQDLNQLLLLDEQGANALPLATKEKLAQQLIEAIALRLS